MNKFDKYILQDLRKLFGKGEAMASKKTHYLGCAYCLPGLISNGNCSRNLSGHPQWERPSIKTQDVIPDEC